MVKSRSAKKATGTTTKATQGQTSGRPAGKADENASKSAFAGQADARGADDKDGNSSQSAQKLPRGR